MSADPDDLLLARGLVGRAVIVTGAAKGIGRAAAELLARAGARVYAVDRDADGVAEVLDALGRGHDGEGADLTDLARHEALLDRATATLGPPRALVHAAGLMIRRAVVTDVTEADWDAQQDVNLKSAFFLARGAAERMKENGGGRIVCFSSQGWWTGGYGGSVAYSASKGGVVSMVRGLARTYGPHGVRINALAPGLADTDMLRRDLDPSVLDDLAAQVPLQRIANPEEVASAALFLCSDHASYITGATINVSGGFLMY